METFKIRKSAEKFIAERIYGVREFGAFHLPLVKKASFFIHIVPLNFMDNQLLDLTQVGTMGIVRKMIPIGENGCNHTYNFDGFATYATTSDQKQVTSYNQILRNGVYEIYTSSIFENDEKVNNIYGNNLLGKSIDVIQNGLNILSMFQVEAPFFIYISIHDIKDGVIIGSTPRGKFTQNDMRLPPVILDEYVPDVMPTIRPLFDILWQSVGWSCYTG